MLHMVSQQAHETRIPLLATVIIARNEEKYIRRCISSVLEAAQHFENCEVLIIDACSVDRTVEIARSFPVRVIELQQSAPRSPALGRRVGQHLTISKYILFVDGDSEIRQEWVTAAVNLMEQHKRVAGVAGKLREVYFRNSVPVGENPDCFNSQDLPEEVYQLGGNAVYRRDALDTVGSFNPYVVSYEEAELAERLRKAGFVVVRLPIHLGTHYTGPVGRYPELRRRLREKLMHGQGQVLRLSMRDGLFMKHSRPLKRYMQFIALLLVGACALVTSTLTHDPAYAVAWVGLCAFLTAAFIARSRSLTKPLRLIMEWSFGAWPLICGFLQTPRDPSRFDVSEVIKPTKDGPEPLDVPTPKANSS